MSGVQFVIDAKGSKTAVVIDLKKHADVWEDFYDTMIYHERRSEPRVSLAEVKSKLKKSGKVRV